MTAVVTGASRGIGFAMADALAAAGADIIGVSASLASSGSADRGGRHGRGPEVRGSGLRLRRSRCRRCARRGARRPGRLRHPRQQRRHDRAGTRRGASAGTVGPRRPGEPVEPVPPHSGAGASDARSRLRQDHLHRLAPQLPGRDQRAGLRRRQVRHRGTHQGAVQRVGLARRHRERHRTRVHRDGQHSGTSCRSRPVHGDPGSDPRRAMGRGRRPRGCHGLPRFATPRTTCPEWCCLSMAAGSDDDGRHVLDDDRDQRDRHRSGRRHRRCRAGRRSGARTPRGRNRLRRVHAAHRRRDRGDPRGGRGRPAS